MAIIFDEQGRPITGDNPFPVRLSGSSAVTIGGATFYADGATLRGLAADLPDAAAAHAVIPYAFYYAVDTDTVYRNTGSAWVS